MRGDEEEGKNRGREKKKEKKKRRKKEEEKRREKKMRIHFFLPHRKLRSGGRFFRANYKSSPLGRNSGNRINHFSDFSKMRISWG